MAPREIFDHLGRPRAATRDLKLTSVPQFVIPPSGTAHELSLTPPPKARRCWKANHPSSCCKRSGPTTKSTLTFRIRHRFADARQGSHFRLQFLPRAGARTIATHRSGRLEASVAGRVGTCADGAPGIDVGCRWHHSTNESPRPPAGPRRLWTRRQAGAVVTIGHGRIKAFHATFVDLHQVNRRRVP